MTKNEVIDLMKTSNSDQEWNANCDLVKKRCDGYPDFWYSEIILSGLLDRIANNYGSKMGSAITMYELDKNGDMKKVGNLRNGK